MTWKTKLKITGPSGSSLNFDGELTTEQKDAVIAALDLPGCTIGKSSAEPFGYFKAEAFGWTDCAETDEGARPLYDQGAIDALIAERADIATLEQESRQMRARTERLEKELEEVEKLVVYVSGKCDKLLAAAIKVNALSIQSAAHRELRAAIARTKETK